MGVIIDMHFQLYNLMPNRTVKQTSIPTVGGWCCLCLVVCLHSLLALKIACEEDWILPVFASLEWFAFSVIKMPEEFFLDRHSSLVELDYMLVCSTPHHVFLWHSVYFLFICFSHVWLFATLWTVAGQAPLSMGFSKQEYWSGLPCPPPGNLLHPGIEPTSLALAGEFFIAEPLGKIVGPSP